VHQRLASTLINAVSASALLPRQVRVRLWRAAGIEVGTIVDVRSGCWMNTSRVTVGEKVFINSGLTVDGFEQVTIGDDCWLGVNVTLLTSSHRVGGTARRAGEITSAPITVGTGCWLGAGVTVLPGVTIGPGCVVRAASVVTKDLEANGLYVGSPARLVRML
jgi:maltose O-acetyltransferase